MDKPFSEYVDSFKREFPRHDFNEHLNECKEGVSPPVQSTLSGANVEQAAHIYALTRAVTEWAGYGNVVETGTANGVFSLSILLGLAHSPYPGALYSVGFPLRASEEIEDHRNQTWSGFKGARIPDGKTTGWVAQESGLLDTSEIRGVPPEFFRYEELVQVGLPRIFSRDSPDPNLWVFDSGHDAPTQTFELEFAFHHGRKDAAIFMDDRAFDGRDAVKPILEKYDPDVLETPGIAVTVRKSP